MGRTTAGVYTGGCSGTVSRRYCKGEIVLVYIYHTEFCDTCINLSIRISNWCFFPIG